MSTFHLASHANRRWQFTGVLAIAGLLSCGAGRDASQEPEQPEHPEHPEHPEQPEHPEHPEQPEQPELDGPADAPPPLVQPSAPPPPEVTGAEARRIKLSRSGFDSARTCGTCHQDIYAKWSRSMHAQAYEDPVFQDALAKAYYASGGEAADLCLRCHSPTAQHTGDLLGRSELTREGVTCDYCHSITAVVQDETTGSTRYELDLTAQHGPFADADSPVHDVAHRPFFERSEFCAGCHDFFLPDGTAVFSTYSEWRASKYAEEGVQCQDCHMPRMAGRTARSDVHRDSGHPVNDHELTGGHSPDRVREAVIARIESVARDADRIRVLVAVENLGAGHLVPTGLPSRKLILTVTARQGHREIFRHERIYQRVMQGDGIHALKDDWEINLRSKRLLRDNRLRPGEVRMEHLVISTPNREEVELSVALRYEYRPKLMTAQLMEVPIVELAHVVGRGR